MARFSIDVSAVPSSPVGVGRYALGLLPAMCSGDLLGDDQAYLISSASNSNLWRGLTSSILELAKTPSNRLLRLGWEQMILPRVLSRARVDLHHGLHYTMPEKFRGVLVVTVHDLTMVEHPEWHERSKVAYFRRAISVAARRADAIVVPSNHTREKLCSAYKISGEVLVIPHGVNLSEFNASDRLAMVPRGGSSTKDLEVELLYVGTIEPRKAIPILIEAFDEVGSKYPKATLSLVGMVGWKAKDSLDAIAGSRYRDRITTYGYLSAEELCDRYRRASLFVYPSFEEGFGLPVLEAMAMGIPVVTTRGTAMAEVGHGCVALAEPGDPDSLAQVIGEELEDLHRAEHRAFAAKEVAASYSWEASAIAHIGLYRKLLAAST